MNDFTQEQPVTEHAPPQDAVAQETQPAAPASTETPPADPSPPAQQKTPWFLTRISEESEKARRANERAEEHARQLREAQEIIARLQRGETQSDPAPRTQEQFRQPPQTDNRQDEINKAAARQIFLQDTVDVRNRGLAQYGAQFNEALNILNAVGATSDDFVSDVLAVDKAKAHEIFAEIAKDPERAAMLSGMNSRQRIAELTRMTMANPPPQNQQREAAPAQRSAVSKAPPPAPQIQTTETKVKDWRADDASEEEFQRGWEARMRERHQNRYGGR